MWREKAPKLTLKHNSYEDGRLCNSDGEVAEALAAFWSATFSAKPILDESAEELVALAPRPADDYSFDTSEEHMGHVIQHKFDSAAGLDGVCYYCWKVTVEPTRVFLWEMWQNIRNGCEMQAAVIKSTMFFIGKGDPDALAELARKPSELRPLALGNTDFKISVSLVNRVLGHDAQRRGITRRNMLDDVLHTESQMIRLTTASNSEVLTLSFDIAAAFPSLSHQWIQRCMLAHNSPPWLVAAVCHLYHNDYSCDKFGRPGENWVPIGAGIRQGRLAGGSSGAL